MANKMVDNERIASMKKQHEVSIQYSIYFGARMYSSCILLYNKLI